MMILLKDAIQYSKAFCSIDVTEEGVDISFKNEQ